MITFLQGMPGDGKSYTLMPKVVEPTFRDSERGLITNMDPFFWDLIAEDLHEEYGKSFNIHSRVRILTFEETKYFYRCRLGYNLGVKEDGRTDFMTLRDDDPGVTYIIDELHEHFNARSWAKTGADALTYVSQHRKLGDQVYFISQRAKQVDAQLRELANSYVYCRNMAQRTMKVGPLTLNFGRTIFATAYATQKTPGSSVEPMVMWEERYKVNPKKYGRWYDTAAGVGVKGKQADKLMKPQAGIHWLWGVAIIMALIVVGFFVVPRILGAGMFKALTLGHTESKTFTDEEAAAIAERLQQPIPEAAPTKELAPASVPQFDLQRPMIRTVQVSRTGFVTLTLTNGNQLTTADGIELLGREGFRFQGKVYPLP